MKLWKSVSDCLVHRRGGEAQASTYIQNPGMALGPAKTPQNTSDSMKAKLAMLAPVSAVSTAAIAMWANVEVKSKNERMYKNIRAPRSWTLSVGSALT